jgi:hypothetical protein
MKSYSQESWPLNAIAALILMFNYVYSEFTAPEWLLKTSLIDVKHKIRALLTIPDIFARQPDLCFGLHSRSQTISCANTRIQSVPIMVMISYPGIYDRL